jgi:hypothetical protein
MPERSGRDLLGEWRRLMDSLISSAAGRSEVPRDLLGIMQHQLELVSEVVERERRMQSEWAGRLLAPVDAAFDLLAETGAALHAQAETLEAAGRALEETAALMKRQAELFERTVGALRQPAELARAATGAKRPKKKTTSRAAPRPRRKPT